VTILTDGGHRTLPTKSLAGARLPTLPMLPILTDGVDDADQV